ncbi:MAG TPA: cation diffusion facilitator family transporter [Candidatus Dormibacteraeota bacterium]
MALKPAFLLTLVILVVEVAAGLAAHSLALLSDAGHLVTDVVALGLAWFAVVQAQRPADARRTYGYHRVGILTAMFNGAALAVIVLAIGIEAARRLANPQPVQGGLVIAAALVAVGVNAFIALRLHGDHADLNVRAALLHVVGDLAASVGVVLAGVIILLTGWLYADPLISIGIAALVAWSAIRIVVDTTNILLEGMPKGLQLATVQDAIASVQGVQGVHDLHVWSISPQQVALSAHIVVPAEQSAADGEHLVRAIEECVCERFDIAHTTIQLEACHPCADEGLHGADFHNHPHREAI